MTFALRTNIYLYFKTHQIGIFPKNILQKSVADVLPQFAGAITPWTETTDGTDYVTVSIFEDSLQSAYKSVADTTVSTLDSGTARTAVTHSITGINVGDILRFTFLIQTESDSMFIGVPKYYVTNP